MSAFLVSRAHIDAMVSAAHALEPARFQRESLDDLGAMLWRENMRSLEALYGGGAPDEDAVEGYAWSRTTPGRYGVMALQEIVRVLKAIDCYEYQSCEHGDWRTSEAREFCRMLRNSLISRLPGYDAAPWGIEDEDVEVAAHA